MFAKWRRISERLLGDLGDFHDFIAMAFASSALLSEYALGWGVHQLAPFLDKAFGLAGAMDHRMIDRYYDWCGRLPLVALAMCFPSSPRLLLIAHVANIVAWFDRMPAVWDYMCWCALLEATFVAAALATLAHGAPPPRNKGAARKAGWLPALLDASESEAVARRFLPAVRAQLVVLYFSAAFWKLTSSWFDTHYSCATVLMSELLSGTRDTHTMRKSQWSQCSAYR